jgi:CubicO group peptidase (beta-lactamase class C family)
MTTDPQHQPSHDVDPAAVRAAVTRVMTTARISGMSLAVTRHDRLLFAEGFGLADRAAGRPATPRTSYLWFSMSKIATATAVMRLADEGRLDLDAPVAEYVAAYPVVTPAPTVRQLLDHTAGLANPLPIRWIRPADSAPDDPAAFLARLLRRYGRPRHPVGGAARYSNLGYLLAAEAVAVASGQPFEQYVERALLRPAGMTRTGYRYPTTADRATGYVRAPRPLTPVVSALLPPGIVGPRHGGYLSLRPFLVTGAGYGGLVGDVVDAACLTALHLSDGTLDGQRVLAASTARDMRRISVRGKPFDHGIGWFRKPAHRDAAPAFVEHYGTGGGFWNGMRLYPDLDLAVVAMANTTHAYDIHALFTAVANAVRQPAHRG